MKRLLAALAVLVSLCLPAQAQQSKSSMIAEVTANLPNNTSGLITPAILRTTLIDLINSYYDFNGNPSFACASHQWVVSFPTLSSATCAQPAIGDLQNFSANTVAGAIVGGPPVQLPMVNCTNGLTFVFGVGFGCNPIAGTGSVTAGGGGIVPITSAATLFAEQIPLGGRISLISGTCVAQTDQVAQTTVYYAPCGGGKYIPIYDGTNMELHQFTASDTDQIGLLLALGSNWSASTLFDTFITLNSGNPVLCTVAWSNSGAGTSARSIAVTQFKGVTVNNAVMTCRINNTTTISVAQYQGTLVGGFLTNANPGQVDLKFGTVAAGGGPACICIWSVYNPIEAQVNVGDSTGTWTYTLAAYRQANGSAGNQINIVQGLAGPPIHVQASAQANHSGAAVNALAGVGVDSVTTDISTVASAGNNTVTNGYEASFATYDGSLAVGYHNVNRLEYSTASGITTWIGNAGAGAVKTGFIGRIWY